MKTKTIDSLAALALTVPVWLCIAMVRGEVILTLAEWFVLPLTPRLVLPGIWTIVGLGLLIGLLFPKCDCDTRHKENGPTMRLLMHAAESSIVSGISLGLGALARWLA